jgi:hypothetical protein
MGIVDCRMRDGRWGGYAYARIFFSEAIFARKFKWRKCLVQKVVMHVMQIMHK